MYLQSNTAQTLVSCSYGKIKAQTGGTTGVVCSTPSNSSGKIEGQYLKNHRKELVYMEIFGKIWKRSVYIQEWMNMDKEEEKKCIW